MTRLTLPADLGIESASDLKALLAPLLDDPAEVAIDGSAASRLHCASLQLLAAFLMHRDSHQLATRLEAGPPLAQAFGLGGLGHLLPSGGQETSPQAPNQEIPR